MPDFFLKEFTRPVKCLRLYILREGYRDRTRLRRVRQHPERFRKACEELLGPRNPVDEPVLLTVSFDELVRDEPNDGLPDSQPPRSNHQAGLSIFSIR